FEDPNFPDRVYKVEKALYGLHQAHRAWYETLSIYLLDNGFQRGKIDKTLFIKRHKGDILLVQVYVDDIIFGSTKKELCIAFEKLMHEKFQMSSMGELTFFLGLQVKQKKDGIFISQDKYVAEILKKFGYQVNLKVSHLHAVKRIFRLISWQCKKQTVVANSTIEAECMAASSCCGQVLRIQNQLLDYRDCNEKKLIQMVKIHTDKNVADLFTKAFDLYLILLGKAKKSVRLIMEKLVIRENRQRVLVRKRIERIGENKNRERAMWNKNRQSDLVSKRIERSGELKNKKRVEYIKYRKAVWNGIGVNVGDSKLLLLGITYYY
ncbi:putative ribonuclease H-like domain-containing protein, partial [Tanacetum coccineum]